MSSKIDALERCFQAANLLFDNYVKEHIDSFYNMYINDVVDETLSPLYIGDYYYYTKYNYTLAEKYYKLAADHNYWGACNNYADFLCYIKEDYDNPDIPKYYKIAIDHGDWSACNNYAYFLQIIKKDYNNLDILKYYKLAADHEIWLACNNYAWFLENIKKDYNNPDIPKYYKLAADHEVWKACNNYSSILLTIKKDYDNPDIPKYYKLAADHENWTACINYAWFLHNIKKDYDNPDIPIYYKLAIDHNIWDACNNYALYLYDHIHDINNAIIYAQLGVDNGDKHAYKSLVKICPKTYLLELKLLPNTTYKQWVFQRGINNTNRESCLICYTAPKKLYRYACFNHTYCLTCYINSQQKTNCCPYCRMPEHQDFKSLFNK